MGLIRRTWSSVEAPSRDRDFSFVTAQRAYDPMTMARRVSEGSVKWFRGRRLVFDGMASVLVWVLDVARAWFLISPFLCSFLMGWTSREQD